MKYMNTKGDFVEKQPDRVIVIDDCYTGASEFSYRLDILDMDYGFITYEVFNDEPNSGEITYAILKNKGVYGELRELYAPQMCI